jgi:hypothetical protein
VIGHLRITNHVHHARRGTVRYRICARDMTHVWIRLVGDPEAEMEKVLHSDVVPIKNEDGS